MQGASRRGTNWPKITGGLGPTTTLVVDACPGRRLLLQRRELCPVEASMLRRGVPQHGLPAEPGAVRRQRPFLCGRSAVVVEVPDVVLSVAFQPACPVKTPGPGYVEALLTTARLSTVGYRSGSRSEVGERNSTALAR